MTIATAKLPGLIITCLISPHPTLTAIAFQYIIIMIGCPQWSHYDTALMLLHVIKSLWSHQSVPMMGRSLELSLVLNTFLRKYIHDETSDTSTNSDLTHIDGHGCVPENDVSITMATEELVGEAAEMMDITVDSKITIFSPTKKALQAWRHPGTNPSHDLESVCTEPTVDTNDSPDCTNEDDIILFLFPELFAFVSDLESELDHASMDQMFRLNSVAIPLVCHLSLCDNVGCIANLLPLEDLSIVGHSDKTTQVMRHDEEGNGVNILKELNPGLSTHDGIHIDADQVTSHTL
jgi:hypothetical protein